MDIREFSPHLFWSYDKDADIKPEIVIRQVIAYGEIRDMILLARRVETKKILVTINLWKEQEKHKKQINFFKKVILG